MDPVSIAIIGTVSGAALLKYVEVKLSKPKDTGSIAISYDERWTDHKYISMIHQTIDKEKIEFGEARTVCECSKCLNAVDIPVVSNKRPVESGEWKFVHQGFVHILPFGIPPNAKVEPVSSHNWENYSSIIVTWYNSVTGERMRYMSVSMTRASRSEEIQISQNLDAAILSMVPKDYRMERQIVQHRDYFLNQGRTPPPKKIERETIRK